MTFSDLRSPFVSRCFDRETLSRDGRAVEAADGVELVSVGRPIAGTEVRVVDGNGVELPEGSVGDVFARGPSIMDGYFNRPEATREAIRDGWLDTGDRGFVDAGELFLTGRKKDVLILRGRCHSPTEVEAAVDEIEGVRTGCSVAVSWLPDGEDGEVLLLLVEAGRGVEVDDFAAIADACRRKVRSATGLEVDGVEVLAPGTLPRTSSGKLRRQESLRLYLADELDAPRPMTPWRLAGAAVRGSIEVARLNRKKPRLGLKPPANWSRTSAISRRRSPEHRMESRKARSWPGLKMLTEMVSTQISRPSSEYMLRSKVGGLVARVGVVDDGPHDIDPGLVGRRVGDRADEFEIGFDDGGGNRTPAAARSSILRPPQPPPRRPGMGTGSGGGVLTVDSVGADRGGRVRLHGRPRRRSAPGPAPAAVPEHSSVLVTARATYFLIIFWATPVSRPSDHWRVFSSPSPRRPVRPVMRSSTWFITLPLRAAQQQ